ncbi:FAD/NAD(P)-binding protein [Pedobacter lithocola]|uniref:FAD/NAD(P)-binding protein n=1 Tax=Pedobacter lithocola TaxID=1908239 RepID=A0ABV8PB95_9SPHI
MKNFKTIAILGGGPSGLFMLKRIVESGDTAISVDIFEKHNQLGAGMPYSKMGANDEHITNVSGNEIPELVTSVSEWITTLPQDTLNRFNINPEKFNDYKVMPRLLFGQYLSAQFDLLQQKGKDLGIVIDIQLNTEVTDIIDNPKENKVSVEFNGKATKEYDNIIICTGHNWPKKNEGKVSNYYDSPYPPAKLKFKANHPVAIKGSSLTAIDAIRTLARHNGNFSLNTSGKLKYSVAEDSKDFRLIMHSRSGMLPAIRFHLEDSHLLKDSVLSKEEILANQAENEGFLSLDYVFDKNFKQMFIEKEPEFYAKIKDMSIEEFVASMMALREHLDPFQLLKAEYVEAEKSIKRKESVYWKEMLAVLSFAMNYPAKHFSAEDMLRLQKTLMPLISIVIAFVPQSSVEEMIALHDAGVLELISVGDDSEEEPNQEEGGAIYHYTDGENQKQSVHFKTFVDCVGQPHLPFKDFPYKNLLNNGTISTAKLKFKHPEKGKKALSEQQQNVKKYNEDDYYLVVPGITINDNFQVMDQYDALNERIYIMAVPYIGGYNPDYSGLDFCEAASATIVKSLLKPE